MGGQTAQSTALLKCCRAPRWRRCGRSSAPRPGGSVAFGCLPLAPRLPEPARSCRIEQTAALSSAAGPACNRAPCGAPFQHHLGSSVVKEGGRGSRRQASPLERGCLGFTVLPPFPARLWPISMCVQAVGCSQRASLRRQTQAGGSPLLLHGCRCRSGVLQDLGRARLLAAAALACRAQQGYRGSWL